MEVAGPVQQVILAVVDVRMLLRVVRVVRKADQVVDPVVDLVDLEGQVEVNKLCVNF